MEEQFIFRKSAQSARMTLLLLGANEALEELNKILSYEPTNAEALKVRGEAKFQLEQYESALDDLNTSLSLEPGKAKALCLRGQVKYQLKQFESALDDLDAALELQPDHEDTLYCRAKTYFELNRARDAYIEFTSLAEKGKRGSITTRIQSAAEALLKGVPMSEFKVTQLLGEGSFGKVHLATWHGRHMALKTPLNVEKKHVIDEAMTLMKFHHRNIVSAEALCYDQNDQVSFVMEFSLDGSLYDLLYKQKERLSREHILKYARDVASGLAYLHEQRVIHRDLKSANILLFGTLAKITDFGQCRFLNEKSVALTIVGTPYFMAPEVLAEQPYDESADIYSFGVVLFEMCTNSTLPIIALEKDRLARISDSIADEALKQLVIDCCKTDPQQRPTSQQCIARIENILEGHQRGIKQSAAREQFYATFKQFFVSWQDLDDILKSNVASMFLKLQQGLHPLDIEALLPNDPAIRKEFIELAEFERSKAIKGQSKKGSEKGGTMEKNHLAVEATLNNGWNIYNKKDYNGAVNLANKILSFDGRNALALDLRGRAKYRLQQYESALDDLNTSLSLEPGKAKALCLRGQVKYQLKQFESALDDLNAAHKIQPYNDHVIYHRADVYHALNRMRDAYVDCCLLEEMKSDRPYQNCMESVRSALSDGVPLSKFQIIRSLGSGSVSKVHLATMNGRQVVLKTPLTAGEKQGRDEALTLMKLCHPNILSVEALCHGKNNVISFMMEYTEDGSLYDLLYTRKVRLTHEQILMYARDVASGLAYLHKRRVIHRDLKSTNVLIFGTLAKIADLGQSRFLDLVSVKNPLSGAPFFITPDLIAEEPYDAPTDVYSFGVVLYEMCTSKKLPIIGSEEERFMRIQNTVEDNDLKELISHCCKSHPEHRPTSQECFERITNLLKEHLSLIEKATQHAGKLLTQKDYEGALKEVNKAIELGAGTSALKLRGRAKYWLNQYMSSLDDLNTTNTLPDDEVIISIRADVNRRLNRTRDAYVDYCLLEEISSRADKLLIEEKERLLKALLQPVPKSNFEITRQIGSGAYGNVYLATWNGRQVALKVALNINSEEVLITEVKASMKLRHPNIVSAEALCCGKKGEISIVMEYAPGGSLYELLYTQKVKLTREQILTYARDVASGLAYLHKRHVIHRDLKSSNILLFNTKVAKICDFGQSRVLNEKSVAMSIVGTNNFMAPEVLAEKPYKEPADIYSFGVVLFEMCTNSTLPIVHEVDRKSKIESEIVDKELKQLIIDCCKTDPEQRPTSQKCFERIAHMLEIQQKRRINAEEQYYTMFKHFLSNWDYLSAEFKHHIVSMFLTLKYGGQEPVDTDKLLPSDFAFREEFENIAKAIGMRFYTHKNTEKEQQPSEGQSRISKIWFAVVAPTVVFFHHLVSIINDTCHYKGTRDLLMLFLLSSLALFFVTFFAR